MYSYLENSKILVVDDSREVRTIIKEYFEKIGASVEIAENGKEGFEKMMNYFFDAVLLDLMMPEMDGFSVLKAIRQIDPIIPVIIITGHFSNENIQKCYDLGASKCFIKPFNVSEIAQTIDELLRNKNNTQ